MSLPLAADIPQQLASAKIAWTKLRRMCAYAAFDGWSLVVLGLLSVFCGGYGSATGLLLSFTLVGTGAFEVRSVRRLRRLDPAAIRRLANNQLVLAGALIFYAVAGLVQSRSGGGGVLSGDIEQALAQAGAAGSDATDQISSLMTILYSGLIAFALLVQGGTARYYFSRGKYLQAYIEATPQWIQQMQRERGEV
jgi:hypothetical protein